jgi:cobalt-zinc-cadmium efflux system outer membrane protein
MAAGFFWLTAGVCLLAQNPAILAPPPPAPVPPEAKPAAPANPLSLAEVLDSVNRNYPPLLAALQERPLAEADVLSTLGRFDINVRARADSEDAGIYDSRRFDAGIDQQLQTGGISYFTGYRAGLGSYASYDGKVATSSAGEYRAGVRVPLFRDRAIDPRRADLFKARLNMRVADLTIDQQRIVITQSATRRYWDWVAAGQRYAVAKAALDIAEKRDQFLREAVAQGALPAIDIADNERVILQRRGFVVEARRTLELATIDLSLFYRDSNGEAVLVGEDRLPPAFPVTAPMSDQRLREDIELALERRPEVKRFFVQRDQIEIDRRLAINQQYPGVDAIAQYYRQLSNDRVPRGPDDIRFGLTFDLPFQRRAARGREAAAEARLTQLDQRLRFQRDQIVAEVQDAVSAVRAAFERVGVLTNEVRVTKQVETAERDRYELGDSNLFTLNLREIATVDAQVREVLAFLDYFRAVALYELAIAQSLSPVQPAPTPPVP